MQLVMHRTAPESRELGWSAGISPSKPAYSSLLIQLLECWNHVDDDCAEIMMMTIMLKSCWWWWCWKHDADDAISINSSFLVCVKYLFCTTNKQKDQKSASEKENFGWQKYFGQTLMLHRLPRFVVGCSTEVLSPFESQTLARWADSCNISGWTLQENVEKRTKLKLQFYE